MLVGLFFFLISGRFPRQLSDENGKMPHERDALPEQLTTDSRSPRLRRLLRLGFQSSLDDRFQSPNQLRLALEGLTGGQQSDPVADALQRLEDVRLSDDVRRRRLAKEHFQAAHEQIIRILSSVDPDNTGLEHRVSAGLTSEGRTADLQSQFFRRAGGLRDIMLEHRLRLDSNSYVASVRVLDNNSDLNLEDWWEYYRGPAGDLDLLLAAITDAAHLALAKVIDAYGEAMGKLRDVDPSIKTMNSLITDDIVDEFVVQSGPDEFASVVRARYGDMVQRVSFDTPDRLGSETVQRVLAGFKEER